MTDFRVMINHAYHGHDVEGLRANTLVAAKAEAKEMLRGDPANNEDNEATGEFKWDPDAALTPGGDHEGAEQAFIIEVHHELPVHDWANEMEQWEIDKSAEWEEAQDEEMCARDELEHERETYERLRKKFEHGDASVSPAKKTKRKVKRKTKRVSHRPGALG